MRLVCFIGSRILVTFYCDIYAQVHYQAGKGGELSLHETTIIAGALDLTQKTAKDAMTPISETFSLDINSKFDMFVPHLYYLCLSITLLFLNFNVLLYRHTMGLIMSKGHSRIPVYSGKQTNIVGIILVINQFDMFVFLATSYFIIF